VSAERPFDPGLQPERTLLAWQRTALALAVGSVAGARLALPVLGAVAVGVGVLGAAAALSAYLAAGVRYRRSHHALVTGESLPGGAVPLLALTAAAVLIAVAALAYVLSLSAGRLPL
jgi:uncharacterized membrane protein YidH (DUF202 family)